MRSTSTGSIASGLDNRDRQRRAGVLVYRVIWSLYLAATYNFVFGSLVVPIILWSVVGGIAAIAAVALLTRYAKSPTADDPDVGEV